jgi:crossover junction endodeoxyribonuclease RuvC
LTRLVVGVDPGATGALALVDPVTRAIVAVLDVPTLAISGWRLIDGAAVAGWLARHRFDLTVLERVDARPTDGRGSIAQFARNAGGLGALLTATGRPLSLVPPSVWKKRAGLVDQPKKASLELARLLFGAAAAERWFPLQKHDGRAEAALIALFGAGGGA